MSVNNPEFGIPAHYEPAPSAYESAPAAPEIKKERPAFMACENPVYRKLLWRMMSESAALAPQEKWFPEVITEEDEKVALSFFDYIEPKTVLNKTEEQVLEGKKRSSIHNHTYLLNNKIPVNKILHYALNIADSSKETGGTPPSFLTALMRKKENVELTNQALEVYEKTLTARSTDIPEDLKEKLKNAYHKILDLYPGPIGGLPKSLLSTRQNSLKDWYKKLINDVPAFTGEDQKGLHDLAQLEARIKASVLLRGTDEEGELSEFQRELLTHLNRRRFVFRHAPLPSPSAPLGEDNSDEAASTLSASATSSATAPSQDSGLAPTSPLPATAELPEGAASDAPAAAATASSAAPSSQDIGLAATSSLPATAEPSEGAASDIPVLAATLSQDLASSIPASAEPSEAVAGDAPVLAVSSAIVSNQDASIAAASSLPANAALSEVASAAPASTDSITTTSHDSGLTEDDPSLAISPAFKQDEKETSPSSKEIPYFCQVEDPRFRMAFDYINKHDAKTQAFPFPKVTYENHKAAESLFEFIDTIGPPKSDPCICYDTVIENSSSGFRRTSNRISYYSRRVGHSPQSVPLQFLSSLIAKNISKTIDALYLCLSNQGITSISTERVLREEEFYTLLDACPPEHFKKIEAFIAGRRGSFLSWYEKKLTECLSLDHPHEKLTSLENRIIRSGAFAIMNQEVQEKRKKLLEVIRTEKEKIASQPALAPDIHPENSCFNELLADTILLNKDDEKRFSLAVDKNWFPKITKDNVAFAIAFFTKVIICGYVYGQRDNNYPIINFVSHYALSPDTPEEFMRWAVHHDAAAIKHLETSLYSKPCTLTPEDREKINDAYCRILDFCGEEEVANFPEKRGKTEENERYKTKMEPRNFQDRQQALAQWYKKQIDALDSEDHKNIAALEIFKKRILNSALFKGRLGKQEDIRHELRAYIQVKEDLVYRNTSSLDASPSSDLGQYSPIPGTHSAPLDIKHGKPFQTSANKNYRKVLWRITSSPEDFIKSETNWFPQVVIGDEAAALSFFDYIRPQNLSENEKQAINEATRKKLHEFTYKLDGRIAVNKILHYALAAVDNQNYSVKTPLSFVKSLLEKEENLQLINQALAVCEAVPDDHPRKTQINNAYCQILDLYPERYLNPKKPLDNLLVKQQALVAWYKNLLNQVTAVADIDRLEERIKASPLLQIRAPAGFLSISQPPLYREVLIEYLRRRRYAFRCDSDQPVPSAPPASLEGQESSSSSTSRSSSTPPSSKPAIAPTDFNPRSDRKTAHQVLPLFRTDPDDSCRIAFDYVTKNESKGQEFPFPDVNHENFRVVESLFDQPELARAGDQDPCIAMDVACIDTQTKKKFIREQFKLQATNRISYYARRVGRTHSSVPWDFISSLIRKDPDLANKTLKDCMDGPYYPFERIQEAFIIIEAWPANLRDKLDLLKKSDILGKLQKDITNWYRYQISRLVDNSDDYLKELNSLTERIKNSLILSTPLDQTSPGGGFTCQQQQNLLADIDRQTSSFRDKESKKDKTRNSLTSPFDRLLEVIQKDDPIIFNKHQLPKITNDNLLLAQRFIEQLKQENLNFPAYIYRFKENSQAFTGLIHYALSPETPIAFLKSIISYYPDKLSLAISKLELILYSSSYTQLVASAQPEIINSYCTLLELCPVNLSKILSNTSRTIAQKQETLASWYKQQIDSVNPEGGKESIIALKELKKRIKSSPWLTHKIAKKSGGVIDHTECYLQLLSYIDTRQEVFFASYKNIWEGEVYDFLPRPGPGTYGEPSEELSAAMSTTELAEEDTSSEPQHSLVEQTPSAPPGPDSALFTYEAAQPEGQRSDVDLLLEELGTAITALESSLRPGPISAPSREMAEFRQESARLREEMQHTRALGQFRWLKTLFYSAKYTHSEQYLKLRSGIEHYRKKLAEGELLNLADERNLCELEDAYEQVMNIPPPADAREAISEASAAATSGLFAQTKDPRATQQLTKPGESLTPSQDSR